jgi:hypothetical protein
MRRWSAEDVAMVLLIGGCGVFIALLGVAFVVDIASGCP